MTPVIELVDENIITISISISVSIFHMLKRVDERLRMLTRDTKYKREPH